MSRPVLFLGLLLAGVVPATAERPAPLSSPDAEIVHHRLEIVLIPEAHRLEAQDQMTVAANADGVDAVEFQLHRDLTVQRVEIEGQSPVRVQTDAPEGQDQDQHVRVPLGRRLERGEQVTVRWGYRGVINDPPKAAPHLRFVTPSETRGHIGSEGVYLSGETSWYPTLPRSLSTFSVQVTLPDGWTAVTQGKRLGTRQHARQVIERWEEPVRSEALTLVANRFVRSERSWGAVQVATYLFPEDAAFADEYLDAAIRYLGVYAELLGPYPHAQFAVVENFFPSGLGMPSFTLLGSGVIKRHYTQPYALGHEIVHGWIGNWVLNEPEAGNWVEGLTTYLTNYYFDEWSGRQQEAREQRRMMLLGYAVHVRPEADYPVQAFRHKTNQRDNAIGYQKAAMVFHMLRREIGEEAFWRGLKLLVRDRGGRYTTWADLEGIFGEVARRDLGWFFEQWITRPGAPVMALEAGLERETDRSQVRARLVQTGAVYRLRVPVELESRSGQRRLTEVRVTSTEQDFTLSAASPAKVLRGDPDFEVFRRIDRQDLPPMLNLFVTDQRRTVIVPPATSNGNGGPYVDVAKRLQTDTEGGPPVLLVQDANAETVLGSVLVLGGPADNPASHWVQDVCGENLQVRPDGFSVAGQHYAGEDLALLVSCRDPRQPDRTVTWFYGTTPAAAAKVARLLFFYGWQSYLVFKDGAVVARGDFPVARHSLEVQLDATR